VVSTAPHPVAQSSCEQSVKDFAQHPAIAIMPAFSIRQCEVAGTHSVTSSTLIATIAVRIWSDATAKGARTSNYEMASKENYRSIASLAAELQRNLVILSELVGRVLIRNCKRHSSHQSLALASHRTLGNRKNIGMHLPAFFLRSDVHTADKQ
jgi:hypothetical protein